MKQKLERTFERTFLNFFTDLALGLSCKLSFATCVAAFSTTGLMLTSCSHAAKAPTIAAGRSSARPAARGLKRGAAARKIAAVSTTTITTAGASTTKTVADTSKPAGFNPRTIDYGITIQDVAFGSGSNQNLPQPVWTAIQEGKPDLFVFVGDTLKLEDKPMAEQYTVLNTIPEYRAFREAVPFLSIWNTQDYKLNGQRDFLQQWSYLRDAIAVGQSGLYHSKIIGPAKKRVQFILLDTRSFRGPRLAGDKPNAPVLGEAQWGWLEEQLARPAEVKFLISSIPVISARQDGESWNNYPSERQRLFDLIKKIKPKNLAILSGGARQGSMAHTGLKGWGVLNDVTTGPLNDPSGKPIENDERFDGPATTAENFGTAQIDWEHRLLTLKLLDPRRVILNSAFLKIR